MEHLASASGGKKYSRAVTVNQPPEVLYDFWRHFENLPRFMRNVVSIQARDSKTSQWIVNSPTGGELKWEAEIIQDKANELIGWRSLPGADLENAGTVRFEAAPGGRGTEVRVQIEYVPPAGVLGATISKLFGWDPVMQMEDDLWRFKALMETGELPTTEGQPTGPVT
jgi:uncharacterized membrane protein